jgi:hypothetical protein
MQVSIDNLRHHVDFLASQPRPPGSEAHAAAQGHIASHFDEHGWTIHHETFQIEGAEGVNIHALNPGLAAETSMHTLIVGAHFDSRPDTPGADDNASAVAALLEIARLLAPAAASRRLQLVAYDLEEWGMLGSGHHVMQLKSRGAPIIGMIALEMLGFCVTDPGSQRMPGGLEGLYPDVGDFIGVVGNERSSSLVDQVATAMRNEPGLKVESLAAPGNGETLPPTRLSDHSPFWDGGLPALMITDTSFFRNPHYHTPADTPETLDYEFLARVTGGVVRAIRGILGEPI